MFHSPACFALAILACASVCGAEYRVVTVAGAPWLHDSEAATESHFRNPFALAVDHTGNVYLADRDDHRIRRISPGGTISTVAGTGLWGYSGDGGPAISARLNGPEALAVDASGNLFIADRGNFRVRRVDAQTGIITTIAGIGVQGRAREGIPATELPIDPVAIAFDTAGRLYVLSSWAEMSDPLAWHIYVVDLKTSMAELYHGLPLPVDVTAQQSRPTGGMLIDSTGSVVFTTRSGIFSWPAADLSPSLVVSDTSGVRAMAIDPRGSVWYGSKGSIRRIRAGETQPSVIVPAAYWPATILAIAPDRAGNVFFAQGGYATAPPPLDLLRQRGTPFDCANRYWTDRLVRRIDLEDRVTTVAGAAFDSPVEKDPLRIHLDRPAAVAVNARGEMYIADTCGGRVRQVKSGEMTDYATSVSAMDDPKDPVKVYEDPNHIERPRGIALDLVGAPVFSSAAIQHKVVKKNPAGDLVAAGSAGAEISAVATDGSGAVYSISAASIWKHESAARSVPLAGMYSSGSSRRIAPSDFVVDSNGDIYFTDTESHSVERISLSGAQTRVAGTGAAGYNADSGNAIAVQLDTPTGLAFDSVGTLYVADNGNGLVRRIDRNGSMTTIAGSRTAAMYLEYRLSRAVAIHPFRIAAGPDGTVYFSDLESNAVRKLVAVTGTRLVSPASNPASASAGSKVDVRVQALDGEVPVPGISVSFAVKGAGAVLASSASETDQKGFATVALLVGDSAGVATVTASAPGIAPVVVSISVVLSAPEIAAGGIAGAGFSTPLVRTLSPGGLAVVVGDRFAPFSEFRSAWSDSTGRMPALFEDVCVSIAGASAFITGLSKTQVNFIVPDVPTGVSWPLRVINRCSGEAAASRPVDVPIETAAPEFFYASRAPDVIAAVDAVTGSVLVRAAPGQYVTLFGTGFGRLVPPGTVAQAAAAVSSPVAVFVNGSALPRSRVLYAGVTPGFAGLYQLNIQLPDRLPGGLVEIVLKVGEIASPAGYRAADGGQ